MLRRTLRVILVIVTGLICLFWLKSDRSKASSDHVMLGSDHVIPQTDQNDVTQKYDFVFEESETNKQSSKTARGESDHAAKTDSDVINHVAESTSDVINHVAKTASDVIKPYFYLVVLVLSRNAGERFVARAQWNNLTHWRDHRNLSINILYLAGGGDHGNEKYLHDDVIYTDFTEKKRNLKLKVQRGIQAVLEMFEFKYILKTDIDVFNNYEKYIEALMSQAREFGYGGLLCSPHINPYIVYCSGMGYVVHHDLAVIAAEFPLEKMADAEDRTMGMIAKDSGVKLKINQLRPYTTKLRFTECSRIKELWNENNKIALHTGFVDDRLYECWKKSFPSGYMED